MAGGEGTPRITTVPLGATLARRGQAIPQWPVSAGSVREALAVLSEGRVPVPLPLSVTCRIFQTPFIRQEPMQTKLTLRLDEHLIRRAKAYAHRSGKSLSELVADLFARLQTPAGEQAATTPDELSPAIRSLAGALAGHDLDREDYRGHLRQKHR